jgi:alpha-ketoglutarate-dependent taurine dioxygenase
MISWRRVDGLQDLPCLAVPQDSSPRGTSSAVLTEWVRENPKEIEEKLQTHGAVLFRGFSFEGVKDFDGFAAVFCPRRLEYVGGNSPRTKVQGGVYTATEYPNSATISLHNEASYLSCMPRSILFYCQTAPTDRGQTPLASSRRIFQKIDPSIRERFQSKRIMYVNNLHGGYGFGRSWQNVFQTEDRGQVEAWLNERGYEYVWKTNGGLRTSIVGEGVAKHPETQAEVWVNQAEQWHPSSLDLKTRNALLSLLKSEEEFPHSAFYGDGSPLQDIELERIRSVLAEEEIIFKWSPKDVLLCDNYLVAHGRQPYTGERKILVALG